MVLITKFLKANMDERGFTLIEVVTAMTLIVIALIPIMLMFNTGVRSTDKASYHSVALGLAQERIEQLRDTAYNDLASVTDSSITISGATFNRTVTVTTPESNLKKIVVNVSWTYNSANRSVSLTTYRTSR